MSSQKHHREFAAVLGLSAGVYVASLAGVTLLQAATADEADRAKQAAARVAELETQATQLDARIDTLGATVANLARPAVAEAVPLSEVPAAVPTGVLAPSSSLWPTATPTERPAPGSPVATPRGVSTPSPTSATWRSPAPTGAPRSNSPSKAPRAATPIPALPTAVPTVGPTPPQTTPPPAATAAPSPPPATPRPTAPPTPAPTPIATTAPSGQ
jgi:hypothetical protein